MATYNFHIRDYRAIGTSNFVDDGSEYWSTGLIYTNTDEVFVLYPELDGTDSVVNWYGFPSSTVLEASRVTNDTRTAGLTYPLGDTNIVSDTVRLRNRNAASKDYILCTKTAWTTWSWTDPATYSTWKNEVTEWLAGSLVLAAGNGNILAAQPDWCLHFYKPPALIVGSNNVCTLAIFYVGNDPLADETIQEIV